MMELFKKLSSQEKMFLYAAVAAGVVAFFDLLFYRPVTSRLRQIEKEIRKSNLAVEQDIRFISYEDKIYAEQEIFRTYQTGEDKTGEEIIAEFLGTVEGLAKNTAVNLSKITPSDVVPKKGAVYYFANLEADGRLEDVIRFMYDIDNTNNLLKIVKVSMEGNKAAEDAVKTSMKVAKLVIDPKTIGNYEFEGDGLVGPDTLKGENAAVKKPDELKGENVEDPTASEVQKDGAATDKDGGKKGGDKNAAEGGGEGEGTGGEGQGQNQGANSGAGGGAGAGVGGTGGGDGIDSAGRERTAEGAVAAQAQNNSQSLGKTQGSGRAGGAGGRGLGGGGTGNTSDIRPDSGTMGRSDANDFFIGGRDNLEPDQPAQEMSPAASRKLQQQQQQVKAKVSGKPQPLNKYQENLQEVKSGGRARIENFESLFTRLWSKVTGKKEELEPVQNPQPLELEYEEEGDGRNLWERKISP